MSPTPLYVKHLAVIKEDHKYFIEYLEHGQFDSHAEVFRLEPQPKRRRKAVGGDLVEIDKNKIVPLATSEAEQFLLDFVKLPKVTKDKVVIYTDGACDIEENDKGSWAGPRAGMV